MLNFDLVCQPSKDLPRLDFNLLEMPWVVMAHPGRGLAAGSSTPCPFLPSSRWQIPLPIAASAQGMVTPAPFPATLGRFPAHGTCFCAPACQERRVSESHMVPAPGTVAARRGICGFIHCFPFGRFLTDPAIGLSKHCSIPGASLISVAVMTSSWHTSPAAL